MSTQRQHAIGLMTCHQPDGATDDSRWWAQIPIARLFDRAASVEFGRELEVQIQAGRDAAARTIAEVVAQATAEKAAHARRLADQLAVYRRRVDDLSAMVSAAEHRAGRAIQAGTDPSEHEQEVARLTAERITYQKRVAVAEPAARDAERFFVQAREEAAAAARKVAHAAAAREADQLASEVWDCLAPRLDRIHELRGVLSATET